MLQLLTLLFALASIVAGKSHIINGKQQSATIIKQRHNLKPGKYRFQNVGSGMGLHYNPHGQMLYAAKGKGSYIQVKTHEQHIALSPGRGKCISAAWSYAQGVDLYGAMYKCSAVHFKRDVEDIEKRENFTLRASILDENFAFEKRDTEGKRLEKRSLRAAKQFFVVHPAKWSHSYHIVAIDHLLDMAPRVVSDTNVHPPWNRKTLWTELAAKNDNDKHQAWYIINSAGKQQ